MKKENIPLQDKLYKTLALVDLDLRNTKLSEKVRADKMSKLVKDLYLICDEDLKPLFVQGMTYKQCAEIMDALYDAWDKFVAKVKENKLDLLKMLDAKSHYKTVHLRNDKFREMYCMGKGYKFVPTVIVEDKKKK